MKLGFQRVAVDTNAVDEEGCLVFADNRLVAVLVRLSELHGRKAGRWYLEHGFGKLDGPAHPDFTDLDKARDWVAQRLARTKVQQPHRC
jgi:hypothetical protein